MTGFMVLHRVSLCVFIIISFLLSAPGAHADDVLSASGRLNVRNVSELNEQSMGEDASLFGRIKLDADGVVWKIHSWLEGGWDGAARRPARDHSLFKSFDEVYQDNNPSLEVKELYAERSFSAFDLRAGIQRFAWGRLDEYPLNDLVNPWDYTQFLRRSLEDRKIGVPSLSASAAAGDWTHQAVWVPWFVPYRLAKPGERWAGVPDLGAGGIEVITREGDLPPRTLQTGNAALRSLRQGDIEWAFNAYHGVDPVPVFKAGSYVITPQYIDTGYEPSFPRITSFGLDAAAVAGDWSIRAEAAYVLNRHFNIRRELWGYPAVPAPGQYPLNPSIELESDVVLYGVGADYRPFEDGQVIIQGQQTIILDRTAALFEKKFETLLWAHLKVWWMNQKIETGATIACNPEHRAQMAKAAAYYTLSDSWKAGVTAVFFNGPEQSAFGRFSQNDQIEAEATYSW